MCRSHVRRSDKYWPRSGGRPLHSTRKHGGSSHQGIVIAFSFGFGIGVIRRNEDIACICHKRIHKICIRFFRNVHNSVLINGLWPIWDFTNDIVSPMGTTIGSKLYDWFCTSRQIEYYFLHRELYNWFGTNWVPPISRVTSYLALYDQIWLYQQLAIEWIGVVSQIFEWICCKKKYYNNKTLIALHMLLDPRLSFAEGSPATEQRPLLGWVAHGEGLVNDQQVGTHTAISRGSLIKEKELHVFDNPLWLYMGYTYIEVEKMGHRDIEYT